MDRDIEEEKNWEEGRKKNGLNIHQYSSLICPWPILVHLELLFFPVEIRCHLWNTNDHYSYWYSYEQKKKERLFENVGVVSLFLIDLNKLMICQHYHYHYHYYVREHITTQQAIVWTPANKASISCYIHIYICIYRHAVRYYLPWIRWLYRLI